MKAIHQNVYLQRSAAGLGSPTRKATQPSPLVMRNAAPLRLWALHRGNQSVAENVHHANLV
jgi:hypothetical protein